MALDTAELVLKSMLISIGLPATLYLSILFLIIAIPGLQTHALYLHRVTLTWFKDLNVPETFGFLHNQVTPFFIKTTDGEALHAWHILPITTYRKNEEQILSQPSGLTYDFSSRLAFKLLRNDADARLVIYLHGTAGCLASGYRPDAYRAVYSAAPDKIHVVAVDYRGYGLSSGTPSEEGLLLDAIALVQWATEVVSIPPSRIVIFAQSLGTAVAISLIDYMAAQDLPVSFAGTVLVAPFSNVTTLTATYRIGGIIPVLSPLSVFPPLLAFFNGFLKSSWRSKDRIANYVKLCESEKSIDNYQLTLIHAQDDSTIPCIHTEVLFAHAVDAAALTGMGHQQLEQMKQADKEDLGSGGWSFEVRTKKGIIREEILKYGSHDKIGAYPSAAMAVFRAFQNADASFGD